MSGEILFLAPRIPFPPDRGDKIRSHHLLKALARLAPVHVGCFAETEAELAHRESLAVLAESHHIARRSRSLATDGLSALAKGRPVSLAAFDDRGLHEWVSRTVATRPIDTVFVFSGQMGQYVSGGFTGRLVVDLCDVDSVKFEAYAAQGRPPRSWIDAREARLLRSEEARLASRADCTLFISEAEANLFRSRCAGARRVDVLPNGVDVDYFGPDRVAPHPALASRPGPHIVFTGQMDYAPNVAAALRVIRSLLPAIRSAFPDAEFHVVGRAPVRELQRHDGERGVRIWGEVPDVRPFLAAADLALLPLAVARGVQNKALEAMAMARPVLLTPGAATGIAAADGIHFTVADGDSSLVARACDLLADKARATAMGASARRFVTERFGWEATGEKLAAILGRDANVRVRDAA